jgi:hypothetical protein
VAGAGDTDWIGMDMESEENFIKRLDVENMKYWVERGPKHKKDLKREEKGLFYLEMSILTIIGGASGLVYGLVAKGYILKPVVVLSILSIILGLSIVIGGFGRVNR